MKHILTILVFIIPFCLFANHKADSLINIAHEYEKKSNFESDTNYIKTLIDVAEAFKLSNPDSCLLFGWKSYDLSAKYGYSKEFLKSGIMLSAVYIDRGDKQNLLRLGNELLPVAEKTDRKSLSKVFNILAAVYFFESQSDKTNLYKAREYTQKVLDLSEEYNDTTTIIIALNNISLLQTQLHDYSSAIESLYRALGYTEKSSSQTGNRVSLTYYNIAYIYFYQKKYDEALLEIQKGIDAAEKENDLTSIAFFMHIAGSIYKTQNIPDKALEYTNKSIEMAQQLNLTELILDSKLILCQTYKLIGLYDESLKAAYELQEAWKETNKDEKVILMNSTIAGIYISQKRYDLALKMCNEVLEIGTDNLNLLNEIHEKMSLIYEAQNNGMKALEHYKQYKIYSDSLFHNDFDEQIINLEAQNKYEKKEMELKAEQAIKEAGYVKDKARLQLVIVFVLILLVSVFAFLIFISQSRLKLKTAYSSLEDANNEIKFQKEEILMQSEEIGRAHV